MSLKAKSKKRSHLQKCGSNFIPMITSPTPISSTPTTVRMEFEKSKEISKKAIGVGHKGSIFIIMANIALLQDDLPEAKKYYTKFQEAYPHRAKETKGLADIYMKEGDL